MKKENIKKYEAPLAKVTYLKTEDVIMESVIESISSIASEKLIGKAKVEWIDIQ